QGPSGETLAAISALPLILPQAAFLFGLQIVMLRAGFRAGFGAVLFTHLALVVPYTMLCFAGPYSGLDPRLLKQAASLNASPWRVFFAVKLPLLATPILTVFAIAFAVSVAQYLTTVMVGAGRVSTLTTEAVALSSGSDRRIAAAFGLMQAALPLVGFALALALPRVIWRKRQGMLA
ncbi:MAG: ABC transporter permease subunit, partial [Deltaproteobacteria bacterium]